MANRLAAIQSSRRIQRSSASVRTMWQYRPNAIQCSTSNRVLSQTQIWEDSYNRPDDVCSRPDAILDKASHAEEVQPSIRQTPWPGPSNLIMEIACNGSATVRTLGRHRPDTLRYFDHNFLLKYRIGTKSVSLGS
jgi:hypothetical protein